MSARLSPQRLMALFDARALRERVLLTGVLAALIFYTWDALLVPGNQLRIKQQNQAIQAQQTQLATLREQAAQIRQRGAVDPDASSRAQLQSVERQLDEVEGYLQQMQVSLIGAKEMPSLLQRALKHHSGLRLLELKTLTARPIALSNEGKQDEDAVLSAKLYEHQFMMRVGGDYLSTLAFLKELEGLPWTLYWDGLAFDTVDGKLQFSIRLHTLSLDREWIGV